MQREIVVKGRSLGGSSDLTLLAPIKPGFVESLESVTYKTRIKRVLETLHGARMAAHEHHTARLLSDAVERVGAIHSVRVAVLEPEDKVLLAVTFDGSWESYIRVLWEKVGTLLDLIFCGTIDYVTARGHTFEEWTSWARRVQMETGFFYGPADHSARDLLYYRRVERMRTTGGARAPTRSDLSQLRTVLPDAEEAVLRTVEAPTELEADDPQIRPVRAPRMMRERLRIGLEGLAALYRLTDLHRPGTPDGDVLRHAAIDLLAEFSRMRDRLLIDKELKEQRVRFERQLDWLFPVDRVPVLRKPVLQPVPPAYEVPAAVRADVQAGILQGYPRVTHGALVLLAFESAAALGAFLDAVTTGAWTLTADADVDVDKDEPGRIYRNLAFTPAGLRIAGLGEDHLELFPEEFRQGMAARAGLLGDLRNNHPRRWRLPRRFTAANQAPGLERVELDGVHAVLQLRRRDETSPADKAFELHDLGHPLQAEVGDLASFHPGVKVLAVQSMRRRYKDFPGRGEAIAEHFGYADGDGQPEVTWKVDPRSLKRNRVLLGELLHGHPNAADEPRDPAARLHWLANGSFLVLRKYRQFVGRFRAAVHEAAQALPASANPANPAKPGEDPRVEEVYAKLMGRWRNGMPLIPIADENGNEVKEPKPDTRLNVFTYDLDPRGEQCPLHAHVRRVNPRQRPGESTRPPRLMRRSMAYGAPLDEGTNDDESVERGLCFMAYNASLGEQFEVVQGWLVGGNSTGSSSGISCPIVGVPENGLERHVHFEHLDAKGQPQIVDVRLENGARLFDPPPVPTQLEWGLYLFVPSMTVLGRLRELAKNTARKPAPWQEARGRALIARLRALEALPCPHAALDAWKNTLEDPESIDRLDSASVWAAIRADHGGVLRTPYGVLVADRALVAEVYLDPQRRYSVCGQLERMRRSFGEIALGMDEGPVYRALADPVNKAIADLTANGSETVFKLAHLAAQRKVAAIVAAARAQSKEAGDPRFEVSYDAREVLDEVLAALSEDWFGIADHKAVARLRKGSTDWAWQRGEPPLYPGHFTALSRYMFQPNPGPAVDELGQAYGQALRESMRAFVDDHRQAKTVPRRRDRSTADPTKFEGPAPITEAIFNRWPNSADNDFVARTMVGVLMGFNPTIIGAVLNVLREWHREGRIGDMRLRLQGAGDYASAKRALQASMEDAARMRPMPQLGWRTALQAHRLGGEGGRGVDVAAGDKVVLGIVSGTQQSLAEGGDDGRLMFGGRREESPSPTHACPGYEAGMQAMLGSLAAMLGFTECDTVRPGAAPQSLVIEGLTLTPAEVAAAAEEAKKAKKAKARQTAKTAKAPAPAPAGAAKRSASNAAPNSLGLVLAWGDSWLDYSYDEVQPLGTDLRDCLETMFGYRVPPRFCKYSVWPKVETMAADPAEFCAALDSALLSPFRPVAILLSAGGNDSTGDALHLMLKDKDPNNPEASAVDEDELAEHIKRLRAGYDTVIAAIAGVLAEHGAATPIILHGYDNPIPAGKLGIKRWLRDPFDQRGYTETDEDMAVAKAAMRRVIEALNDMLGDLASGCSSRYGLGAVHVDLRGTIAKAQQQGDPAVDWDNDLHPNSAAFALMAQDIHAAIQRATQAPVTPGP